MTKPKNKNSEKLGLCQVLKRIPIPFWTLGIGILLGIFISIIYFWPSSSQPSEIETHGQSYTVSYNGKTKSPDWVSQLLSTQTISKHRKDTERTFQPNPEIPTEISATLQDYIDGGFGVGLLVFPTNNDDPKMTYSLSNAAPIKPALKSGYWKKIDEYIYEQIQPLHNIQLFSGPLYLQKNQQDGKHYALYQLIGKNEVAVPSHFFRILYTAPGKGPEIYIFPNEEINSATPLKSFSVSQKEFTKLSGITIPNKIETLDEGSALAF